MPLAVLWDHAHDQTALTATQLNHLRQCEDCVGILWLCRGGNSSSEVEHMIKEQDIER